MVLLLESFALTPFAVAFAFSQFFEAPTELKWNSALSAVATTSLALVFQWYLDLSMLRTQR